MKKLVSIALFIVLAVSIITVFSSPSNAQYPYYQNPYPYQTSPSYPSTSQYPYYQNPQQSPAGNPAPSQYPQQQPQNSPSSSAQQQYQNPPSRTTNMTASNSTNTTTVLRPTQYPPNQQQPQLPSFATTNPTMSTLMIITRVNNSKAVMGIGNANQSIVVAAASSFSQVITNAFAISDGYTLVYHYIRGSQTGVIVNLMPGIFTVTDQSNNNRTTTNPSPTIGNQSLSYTPVYSGDCSNLRSIAGNVIGYGQINPGETKTCIVTYNR